MSEPTGNLQRSVVAFSGGIGGAKLALGLYRILAADRLMLVANTGDDFEHLGLSVCPDLDTLMYTLSGLANREAGWGLAGETWSFMAALERLGGETWFNLGDHDLATHVERTRRLRAGERLSAITDDLRQRLGIGATLLPMSDDPVRTKVSTAAGELDFQRYFVEQRCVPVVTGFRFDGAERAQPLPAWTARLAADNLHAVVICPSNPFISIDPILALPGARTALTDCRHPVIAVSPIIGADAVKGPTAKMMRELGLPTTSAAVARHYQGLIDGLVLDESDRSDVDAIDIPCHVTRTFMQTNDDRERLAGEVLEFAERLRDR